MVDDRIKNPVEGVRPGAGVSACIFAPGCELALAIALGRLTA